MILVFPDLVILYGALTSEHFAFYVSPVSTVGEYSDKRMLKEADTFIPIFCLSWPRQ